MIKEESALQTANFWYDLNSIEKYCNAILTYFKKDVTLNIRLGGPNEVPRVNVERGTVRNRYNIVIPKIASFLNEDQLKQQINLRKIFLKHELSHICFTPMVELNMLHNGENNSDILKDLLSSDRRDLQMIYNALEDIRIESLMGTQLEGTNDNFFEAVHDIAIKNDWVSKIVNEKISPLLFGIYSILRAKNVFNDKVMQKISEYRNINAYESVYKKYSDFHEKLSQDNIVDIMSYLKNILNDIRKIQAHFDELEQNDSLQNFDTPDMGDSNDQQDSQTEKDANSVTSSKSEEHTEDNNEDGQMDTTQGGDSDGDEDKEDSDQTNSNGGDEQAQQDMENGIDDDYDQEMQSSIDEQKKEDEIVQNAQKQKTNSNDSIDNTSIESSLKKEFMEASKQNKQQQKEDLKEDIEQLKEEIDSQNGTVIEIDSYGNLQDSGYDTISRMIASSSADENLADNYSKMYSAVEIPLKEIWRMSSSPQKIKKASNVYSSFVRKHTKEISLLSVYFKNKFKDRKKITMIANKEDGYLDDQMLYKVFSNKDFETKIFLQIGKKITAHANFIFLLDFSGSMSGSKLLLLIKTMIILNEVLNKIGIKFMMYAFSGSAGSFTLPNENMHRLIKSPYVTRNGSSYYLKENLNSDNYPFVYMLKNLEERQSIPLKAFLGNIITGRGDFNCMRTLSKMGFSIGASTKEYQSLVYLTKKYDHMKNKNMIIVNDGHYDTFAYDDNAMTDMNYESRQDINDIITSAHDQMLFDFLYERKIKLNKFSYDVFSKMLKDFLTSKVTSDNLFKDDESKVLTEYANDLFTEMRNEFEYFGKKEFIKCKHFDINLKKQNDYVYMTLQSKKSFTDLFTVKAESIPYHSYHKNTNIVFNKSDKKVFYNIVLEKMNFRFKTNLFCVAKNSVKLTGVYSNFGSTNSLGDQLYKNKINLLRKRNWGIYGIGIQDSSQAAYVGDKFSSVIQKTQNLTTEISKILH